MHKARAFFFVCAGLLALFSIMIFVPTGVFANTYQVVINYDATWAQAKAAAEAAGGYLATITSDSEQAVVEAVIVAADPPGQGGVWINLRETTEACYVWDNGESTSYGHFLPPFEPNNLGGDETRGHILWSDDLSRRGYWNDIHENGVSFGVNDIGRLGYVIEFGTPGPGGSGCVPMPPGWPGEPEPEPEPEPVPVLDPNFVYHDEHFCGGIAVSIADRPYKVVIDHAEEKRTVESPVSIPSPANCSVDGCLVTCPAGDLVFHVTVRDVGGVPIAGSRVELDFSRCPSFASCEIDPVDMRVETLTDAIGVASFQPRMGGLCEDLVRVYADGYLLANMTLASPDQNGDLIVDSHDLDLLRDKMGSSDPTGDLNCDGVVNAADEFGTSNVPGEARLSFALDRVHPNPARSGGLTVRYSLPTDAPARLDLLDVAGRRIASHEVGAGQHTLDLGQGQRLAPGLYLVRLTQGTNTRTTRAAVLR